MGTTLITLADQDDTYLGFDPTLGRDITLGDGQVAEITDEHLARLAEDWPKRFRKLTKQQAEKHAEELAAQRATDAAAQAEAGLAPTPDPDPAAPDAAATSDPTTTADQDADGAVHTDASDGSDAQ